MSGMILRAATFGLLILCLCGAPLIPASAAMAPDAVDTHAASAQADGWHPLSFVYSLLHQLLGDDQDLEVVTPKSSSSDDLDAGGSTESGTAPEIPTDTCYGPGIDPMEC
jgi:hypothetical protein